jgi:translation elongation factor EF-G
LKVQLVFISLKFKIISFYISAGKEEEDSSCFLLMLIDLPGHAAVLVTDGVLVVVDCVSGQLDFPH